MKQDQSSQFLKLLEDRLADLENNVGASEQMERILQSLVEYVSADVGKLSFFSADGERQEPGIVAFATTDNPISETVLSCEDLIEQVRQERQARLMTDYPQWDGVTGNRPQVKTPLCALAVPLLIANNLEGVLSLASGRDPSFFDQADLEAASLFARVAAIAIQSERRLQMIERLITTDSLTGVWTRNQFFERAEQVFRQALRYQRPLSAILIDIDRFKMLNEMHGYSVGDQVLGTVVQNIVSRLRDSDLVGRYGGEEFILLLPETDLEHARLAAERMRTQIAAAPTETPKGIFFITISAGVASLESAAIDQLDRLVNLADQAMHAAKLSGRNQVAVYTGGQVI